MTTATRFGKPLPEGGTIGVFAPCGPYDNRSDVLRPVEWCEARGYKVKLTDSVWARDDYVAGPAEVRVADMQSLFADPAVDVVHCLWGGVGAIELLPLIDYDLIAAHPKALMGYSDVTNLHVALLQESGLATFHGPGFGSFGATDRDAFTWDSALHSFQQGGTGVVPRDPNDDFIRVIRGGTAQGPLVGGNLYTLNHLIGTTWQPNLDGAILLIEEVDTMSIHFDVMFWQLRLAGLFENVAGIVVSQLESCGKPDPEVIRDRSLEDVLEEHLGALGVPVIYGLPLGHGSKLASVPFGVLATIDGDRRTLTIDEPGVRELT